MISLPLSPARECGPCQACCEVKGIIELRKPRHTVCPHQRAAGCDIYAARPPSCREFNCLWLIGKVDGERPDRLGLVMDATGAGVLGETLVAWETAPGTANRPNAAAFLADVSRNRVVVLMPYGSNRLVLHGPPADVDEAIMRIRGSA